MIVAIVISIAATFAAFAGTNNGGQSGHGGNNFEIEVPEEIEPEEPETETPTEPETEPEEPETEAPTEEETEEETEAPTEETEEETEAPTEETEEEVETETETQPETQPEIPETEPVVPDENIQESQPDPENNYDDDDDDDYDRPHRTWRPEDLYTGPGVETTAPVIVIEESANQDVPETTEAETTAPAPTITINREKPNRDLPKTADSTHNVPVCVVAVLVIVGGAALLISNRRK